MSKIQVFKEDELDQVTLGSSISIDSMLEEVKSNILTKPGQAAVLSDVCKELEGGDVEARQTASLAGKFKRYCGEGEGKGGFKIVKKDKRNILVRTA